MSRFYDDGDDEYMPRALYQQAVRLAITGKRGQAALRELETALLALPSKRLIEGHLCRDGEVCALGALAVHRGVLDVADPPMTLYTNDEPAAYEVSEWAREKLGLREALATQIQWQNDEAGWMGPSEPPEERYKRVLAWVQGQLS